MVFRVFRVSGQFQPCCGEIMAHGSKVVLCTARFLYLFFSCIDYVKNAAAANYPGLFG